jgi:carboxymethylenebutenolidase
LVDSTSKSGRQKPQGPGLLGAISGLGDSEAKVFGSINPEQERMAQAEIKAALAGKPNATVYSYPGQCHAFSRHNGAHYNAAAATLANARTKEFLHRQLQ